MKKLLTLYFSIFALALFSASAQTFDYENIAPHPRIMLTKGDITKMRELPAKSANAKLVHDKILSVADGYLNAEPIKYEKQGQSMSHISQEALKRVFYLAYAHLTTDDMRYVAAAEREMLAASNFPDWNPSHFSDVAEMTMALAIGYDWLYRRLSVHSRSIIGTAIYEKGLRASEAEEVDFWEQTNHSNLVCNAGMVYGALATLERSPEFCKALISKCAESNKNALKDYSPEGYSCWEYRSSYEAMLAAALESSLGNNAGITDNDDFMRSAEFVNLTVAPSGKIFNFGDCILESAKCMPAKYWFARKNGNMSLVARDEQLLSKGEFSADNFLPLYMLNAISMDLDNVDMPTDKVWCNMGETPLFIYRSGWEEGDTFFAIKGGTTSSSHAHMDAGSFVYERDGVRWAIDLGKEDEDKLSAAGIDLDDMGQKSTRWEIFRMGADSHNTLSFKGTRHNVNGKAEITSHSADNRDKRVTLDLTPIFDAQAQRVSRAAHLDKKNYLTITDQIDNVTTPSTLEWHITTQAEAEIVSPQMIMLKQEGKTLYLRIKTRANAIAKIWHDEKLKPYETPTEGIRRVGFSVDLKAGESATLEVQLSPIKTNVLSRIKQTFKRE